MKNLVAASILILIVCAVSLAQTRQIALCPAISVSGPSNIVLPGETGAFTAVVDDAKREQYTYSWKIEGATIVEEDGKSLVNFGSTFEAVGKTQIHFQIPPEMAGASTIGIVEIKGLPEGCPNTASESFIFCGAEAIEIDEFSVAASQIDKVRLRNLAVELQKNPSGRIFIIERFEGKTAQKVKEQKNQKTIDYLKAQGIEKSSITLLNETGEENLTKFIFAPSGAPPPICGDCVIIK